MKSALQLSCSWELLSIHFQPPFPCEPWFQGEGAINYLVACKCSTSKQWRLGAFFWASLYQQHCKQYSVQVKPIFFRLILFGLCFTMKSFLPKKRYFSSCKYQIGENRHFELSQYWNVSFFPKDKIYQMGCFLLVINLIIIVKCLVRFMKLYTLPGGLMV